MVRPGAVIAAAVLLTGCVGERERSAPAPEPRIADVQPAKVTAGRPFNVQKDGNAALAVTGENLFRGSRLLWNGEPLETYGYGTAAVSAIVPRRLYEQSGRVAITVEQPGGRISNALPLTVFPATGAAPVISELFPPKTRAGTVFNRQSNGGAAMGLTGANFRQGVVVVFGGVPLETVFSDVDRLSALVPANLLEKPGAVDVVARNPDGKASAPARFTVTAR
jgi:hypothetical protein